MGTTSAGGDVGLLAGESGDISDPQASVGHLSLERWAGGSLGDASSSAALSTVVAGEHSTFSRHDWVLET